MAKRRWIILSVILVCAITACGRPAPPPGNHITPPTPMPATHAAAGRPSVTTRSLPDPTSPPASPAYPGTYDGTPTPDPTPRGEEEDDDGTELYTIQPGETLSLIAAIFGCTVDEIVSANGLASANSVQAGQVIAIPTGATETGPYRKLIPDSEMVYGPAYIHFDLAGFVADQNGYLVRYTETVEGTARTGAEIVQLVSQRFSIGPRVLLTLLELRAGWVTHPTPTDGAPEAPLGPVGQGGLFEQLSWAAVKLNQGYYGWKYGQRTTTRLGNGIRASFASGLNPGTTGLQNCLAGLSQTWEEWIALTGTEGFAATYEALFGNPFAYTVEPLLPGNLAQPVMALPWEGGKTWYFTGGPHGGWGNGSGLAAVDFVPGDKIPDCTVSGQWVTAATAGRVLRSDFGEVVVELDGDGYEESGWVVLYMHIHRKGRVEPGTTLQRGDRIGHPSCEGGFADASHLHFARRYNGEWIPAGDGPAPMVIGGWRVHADRMPYDGTLTRGDRTLTALEQWNEERNGLTSTNVVLDE